MPLRLTRHAIATHMVAMQGRAGQGRAVSLRILYKVRVRVSSLPTYLPVVVVLHGQDRVGGQRVVVRAKKAHTKRNGGGNGKGGERGNVMYWYATSHKSKMDFQLSSCSTGKAFSWSGTKPME